MKETKIDQFKESIDFYLEHKDQVEAFGLYHLVDRDERRKYSLGRKLHDEASLFIPSLR